MFKSQNLNMCNNLHMPGQPTAYSLHWRPHIRSKTGYDAIILQQLYVVHYFSLGEKSLT